MKLLRLLLLLACAPWSLPGAELVSLVRNKLSAGDVQSGLAAAEDYRRKAGVDAEYLNAVAWLARGAEMLRQPELAAQLLGELRREMPEERKEWLGAYGAVIEVEGRLRAAREGVPAALRYWEGELAKAREASLRGRIRKNLNLFSLVGQPAPELALTDVAGPAAKPLSDYRGRPVLLFLWAHWCGDCRAQGAALTRIWEKYGSQGLVLLAPTRYFGTAADGKEASPADEKAHLTKLWQENYPGLREVPVVIDAAGAERYGAAAYPTFVLIDRRGQVRSYAPTRLSEAELGRRLEEVLREPAERPR